MPTMPRPQCAIYGCKTQTRKGSIFCDTHAPPTQDAPSRADADAYKSAAWRSIRAAQLSRDPLCAGCRTMGIVRAATVVDHVWPWRKIGAHAFRANRYQSVCVDCHSLKTGLEQRGICREFGIKDWALTDYATTINP